MSTGFDTQVASAKARQSALRGFAVGTFYPDEIYAGLLHDAKWRHLAFRLSHLGKSGTPFSISLLDNRVPALREGHPDWSGSLNGLAGDNLLLEVWSLSPWQAGQSAVTKIYLVGSVLFILFVTVFVLVAAGQNVRTTRKVAERTAELSNLEARLRSILDNMAAFVGEMTPAGILVEINQTALDVSSMRREDVIGKRLDETWWFSHSPEVQAL